MLISERILCFLKAYSKLVVDANLWIMIVALHLLFNTLFWSTNSQDVRRSPLLHDLSIFRNLTLQESFWVSLLSTTKKKRKKVHDETIYAVFQWHQSVWTTNSPDRKPQTEKASIFFFPASRLQISTMIERWENFQTLQHVNWNWVNKAPLLNCAVWYCHHHKPLWRSNVVGRSWSAMIQLLSIFYRSKRGTLRLSSIWGLI